MNRAQQLAELGQSVWYDNIQRGLLENGEMAGMISRGEIRGVTANPTIFMKAITGSTDYDAALGPLAEAGYDDEAIFWKLAIEDIQTTTDLFRPLYEQTKGGDGFASIEVGPELAYNTDGTLADVISLWRKIDRPNLMVKIPATEAGIPAIRKATAAGINVNITLIFSRQRYAQVMDAYLSGLEDRVAAGQHINHIASVASFFVSRVDTNVDKQLQKIVDAGGPQADEARALLGKVAIGNAKLAYADFKRVFNSDRFKHLQSLGARVQRPLWASTGTKNPLYSDVYYIDSLIGQHTVNTIPPKTLTAFLDHGTVRLTIEEDLDAAQMDIDRLAALGISLDEVTAELERDGITAFVNAIASLLAAIKEKRMKYATAIAGD